MASYALALKAPRVNPFFDRAFNAFVENAINGGGHPRYAQDDKSWTITLDMPGVAREDLVVNVEGSVMRIETRAEAARRYKFGYEFELDIDVDATSAKLENGVLTLTVGKKQPVSNARQITVN